MDATAKSTPVLRIENASKAYADRPILRSVNLTLNRGERMALMGPSGSGKTTLLNCIGGIDHLDDGSILVEGTNITQLDEKQLTALRRNRLGTIFQFFHLLPTLTVYENIELPLLLQKLSERERRERVSKLLQEVAVDHRFDALPENLSGGERQRVAIARALAVQPALLLADEPTGNLDTRTGNAILDLIARVCEIHQTALLMVTHNTESVRICHHVAHMRDGCVETAQELQPRPVLA